MYTPPSIFTGSCTDKNTSSSPVNLRPRSKSLVPVALISPSVPHSSRTDQPNDDASIIRLFMLIDKSITDHVLNYYISPNTGSEKFSQVGRDKKELEWILRAAPLSSLEEAGIQIIVIRAIIGFEVYKAIQEDFFVPPSKKKVASRNSKQGMDGSLDDSSTCEIGSDI